MTDDRKAGSDPREPSRRAASGSATRPDGAKGRTDEELFGSGAHAAAGGEPPPVDANEAARFDLTGPEGRAWRAASSMVNRFKPVPWLLWIVIRGVYGKSGELGTPDPMSFSPVEKLLVHALTDRTLAKDKAKPEKLSLSETVRMLGYDVAGSLAYIHAVCRRVNTVLNEKVSRPILDDALLRTHIGYHVGQLSPVAGAGRGMIAGFSGRSGLAIQMASGTLEQGQKALAGLAGGTEISKVCTDVYGCDPLKVAALALISGGCSRDIANGIASYSAKKHDALPGSEQFMWLCLFTVIEQLRMARNDQVTDECWRVLGYDPARKAELAELITQSQRRGHGWRWITQPQTELAGAEKPKPAA